MSNCVDISLDSEQMRIIQEMFRFMDNQNVDASELLDCDPDDYNDLSGVFGI